MQTQTISKNTAEVYILRRSQRRQCAGIGLLVFMRIGTHTIKAGRSTQPIYRRTQACYHEVNYNHSKAF